MLERYFMGPQCLRRLRAGPLGVHLDGLAARLEAQGYRRHSARSLLRGAAHFSHYLLWRGVCDAGEITSDHVQGFLKDHLPNCACERPNFGLFRNEPAAVEHMLQYLQAQGVLRGPEPVGVSADSVAGVLLRYRDYLIKLRGLSAKSCDLHMRVVKRFLEAREQQCGGLRLSELTRGDVLAYAAAVAAAHHSVDWKASVTSTVRVFLRFLCWERVLSEDLSRSVPSVIQWKLADIPKNIPFEEVRQLIEAPDRSTPTGKRDRAVLMLLGILGLRAGEVAALCLDHLDWRGGSLKVPAAKSRRERVLPVPSEVAEALCDYIQNGRPRLDYREVFVSSRAPLHPMGSTSVSWIVRKYVLQAGIDAPKKGSHMLRHSLATHLLNEGVAMKEIADILGHGQIETTQVYAKVDLRRLREVPLPFPLLEGEGR